MLKLNIGAGGDLRPDYINIDIDSKEQVETRYGVKLSEDIVLVNYDIFNLPYADGSVDEVMCLGFLEHLSFEEEGRFLGEVNRVLKKDGLFRFTVPDFEKLVRQWLEADDCFIDFYKLTTGEHWFGNGDRNIGNRWGYLTASIFGNQNGQGQFHKNAYTKKKIKRIMDILGFRCGINEFYFKDTEIVMLECVAIKTRDVSA